MTDDLWTAAARTGEHCWVERRLFEVVGAWSVGTGVPAVTVLADRLAQHAAWRAGQWWDRLPVLAQLDREAQVRPGLRWAWMAGAVPGLEPPAAEPVTAEPLAAEPLAAGPVAAGPVPADPAPAAAGGLAVLVRLVLPRLAADYARRAGDLAPHVDGATVRTLGQMVTDLTADWLAATVVLDDLGDAGPVRAAAGAALAAATEAAAADPAPAGAAPER